MAKRTHHPDQLSLDFDAPIAEVVEAIDSTTIVPAPGMQVTLHDGSGAISLSHQGQTIGYVDPSRYAMLSTMLCDVDTMIEAEITNIGSVGHIEVAMHRVADERRYKNFVRAYPLEGRLHSAWQLDHARESATDTGANGLISGLHLTTPRYVSMSVGFNLLSDQRKLSLETARRIMTNVMPEPLDRSRSIFEDRSACDFVVPMNGATAMNCWADGRGLDVGWAMIHGIEDGWYQRKGRSRFYDPAPKLLEAQGINREVNRQAA